MSKLKRLATTMLNLGKSKVREVVVRRGAARGMLKEFPESVVGAKNMSTQFKTVNNLLKKNDVVGAWDYVKSQRGKVSKQGRMKKMVEGLTK